MSIAVQLCGLLLLSVVLFFYLNCKKVFLNTESAFFMSVVTSIFFMVVDVVAVLALKKMDTVSPVFLNIINRLYQASLLVVVYYSILYVFADLYGKTRKYRIVSTAFKIALFVQVVLVSVLPMYYMTRNNTYIAVGASVMFAYVAIVGELLVALVALARYNHLIDDRRKSVVTSWLVLWIVAMVAMIWLPGYITVSFTIAIGILIIYIKLENPESAIDKETGLFNQNTFHPYIGQRYENEKPFSFIKVFADNFNQATAQEICTFKHNIVADLNNIKGTFAFNTNEDEFYILYESREEADKKFDELYRKYVVDNKFVIKPHIMYMPDSKIVKDINEMLQLFRWGAETLEIIEKGCLIIDENASEHMKSEIEMGKYILEAIDNDRVEVFYQPIYSTEKGYFTSAEALVRIRDKEGKIIPPNMFIGIAEKNGSILKLGEVVFEKVCKFLDTTDAINLGLEYVEVNLSVVQCEYEGLANRFIEIMKEHNIPGNRINLEITESATMTSKNRLIRNIAELKNFGVGFSLDDFGTGQSNLNYIVEMPVDIVKFDRGMINAYFESHKAKYVMDAAMHMIQGLKLDIVSEGIETEEQLSTMKNLGIQYIQGYYFSKPLPESECLEFLKKRNGTQSVAMQS